ncbi:sulfatase [Bremerella sp. P1]|uniref:sulfatase n=1 Tax=Bremerella sp. P1 TaxID=3026424 RepID=UPI0023689B3D|nr:sulfatase [Bremerella sp. P1]WDI43741.1 sulfatase [Bremerella sp. P1]
MINLTRRLVLMSALAVTAVLLTGIPAVAAKPGQPNIVFLLVDDLGIKDLSCYGSEFHESPNIDQLASQGICFTNAYASHPTCGPSRTGIVTGKFPARMNLLTNTGAVRNGEMLWPKVLQQHGYATYFLGKWHMGNANSVFDNGFDVNIAGCGVGQPSDYYFPYKSDIKKCDVPDMEDGKPGDYLTDALTDKALKLLDGNGDKPFLLYFSYFNVHKPAISNAQGKKEHVESFNRKLESMPQVDLTLKEVVRGGHKVQSVPAQRNPEFAGQIKALDDSVGRIMQKLDELGIADNTIVVLTSDQGSMCTSRKGVSTAAPYRFGKGFLFEGGIRVPLIVKWPGHMTPGTTNPTVTINTDIYPTMMDILGLPKRNQQHMDGISIVETFEGTTMRFNRTFYWAFPQNHALGHRPSLAIRRGPYKLIYWPENGVTELYDVESDISESVDLSRQKSELAAELLKGLKAWKPASTVLAKFE